MGWADQLHRQTSTIEPRSEIDGALSYLEETVDNPSNVIELGIRHPPEEWPNLDVEGGTVDEYMKDVASRVAFDHLLVDPWEDWDEDLYVDLVEGFYGRLAAALDEAVVRDIRTVNAYRGPHRQQSLESFIPTDCMECGGGAEYIAEHVSRFQEVSGGVKDEYE